MEELFSMVFSWFICFRLLLCDYERKVWIELIMYVFAVESNELIIMGKNVFLKQRYENFGTFFITNDC